jgi:hypothetical protein
MGAYHYIRKARFYRETYGRSYLVRIEFEVRLSNSCQLVADNLCRCDSWFANGGTVNIKYHVLNSGDLGKTRVKSIKKSLIVDMNRPLDGSCHISLTVTNNAGLTDLINVDVAELEKDHIKIPQKA